MGISFHGNWLTWAINHFIISLDSKYQSSCFICFSIMPHYLKSRRDLPVLYLLWFCVLFSGDVVGDLCAAPGGKTLGLLFTKRPQMVVATDKSSSRLNRLREVTWLLFCAFMWPWASVFFQTLWLNFTQFYSILLNFFKPFDLILLNFIHACQMYVR